MKSLLKITLLFFITLILFSCQNEAIGGLDIDAEEVITVNSELYNNLARIANDPENTLPVTCVEFNYPITMYAFDSELQLLASTLIQSDNAFVTYLNNLENDYSISISYPIATTLEDGTLFTINNNQELQENIEACMEEVEEIEIENCLYLLANCVWKVGYTRGMDNSYLGAVFNHNYGSTVFTHNNQLLFGSWTPLFIEGELHINISLNNSNEIGTYFNYDWKVEYLEQNSMQLTHGNQSFVIHQYCDDDFALCTNFIFEECEIENNPGVAQFTFNDYKFCIRSILRTSDEESNLLFFETYEDAENNTNALSADQIYLNTTQYQFIYVRVEDNSNNSYFVINIALAAIPC